VFLDFISFIKQSIVEMGANQKKKLNFYASIANPDYGYITNFGKRISRALALEGVIEGKSEMYQNLKS
jgi:UDP-N-acetylmuramoyl-tripeptide--D-alanyl-D-alanine ligase